MKLFLFIKKCTKKIKSVINKVINFKTRLIYIIPLCLVVVTITTTIVYFRADFLSEKKIEATTQNVKSEMSILESKLDDYRNELKTIMEIRDRYRLSIKEIVDMLYHKDIAMGGTLQTIPNTDKITLLHLRNVVQSMDDDMKLLEEAKNYLLARKEFANNFPFIWPVLNTAIEINSNFGFRSNRETNSKPLDGYHFHSGIDLNGQLGDLIIATAGGKVVYTTKSDPVFGYLVIIQHKYEFSTYYGHLNTINVKMGQSIKRGHVIGTMGNTGINTGIHLHYEIRVSGTPIDPLNFLSIDY